MDDACIKLVVHHTGHFVSDDKDGKLKFDGERVKLSCDPDLWSYFGRVASVKDLGHIDVKELWYNRGVEDGQVVSDGEVEREMVEGQVVGDGEVQRGIVEGQVVGDGKVEREMVEGQVVGDGQVEREMVEGQVVGCWVISASAPNRFK
ncbi:hypothetical protein LR48_Vigan11g075100 [Vigna angularis]|uniref:PB1-like domain-containing protein n=1 Tax=Phaseolus angularis TaxID=3914 RepID=A0A0L9VRZ0_PHAAN|nr:hypothetical protein LR48_Vigan11g075100 [Vigna angularis]